MQLVNLSIPFTLDLNQCVDRGLSVNLRCWSWGWERRWRRRRWWCWSERNVRIFRRLFFNFFLNLWWRRRVRRHCILCPFRNSVCDGGLVYFEITFRDSDEIYQRWVAQVPLGETFSSCEDFFFGFGNLAGFPGTEKAGSLPFFLRSSAWILARCSILILI